MLSLKRRSLRRLSSLFISMGLCVIGSATHVNVTKSPTGYSVRSVELGVTFAGALAQHPSYGSIIYVSSGDFGAQRVLRVNTDTGTTVALTVPLGAIGGIAAMGNDDLAITETMTSDTILRVRDMNSDGDCMDAGEVAQLIAPVLTDNFSGSQVAVAPAGNASGIPAGSLVVQTADGETSSELLVIENPAAGPAYRPAGGAYYSGFQYNGGFAFDAAGNIICGISQLNFSTWQSSGKIVALLNSNANSAIDAGESRVLLDETVLNAGLADLAVSLEGKVFYGENSGAVKWFGLPTNLMSGTASAPTGFLQTDSAYISTLRFDYPQRSFAPGAQQQRSRLYVGGLDSPYYGMTTNILIVTPLVPSAAEDWQMYQ